MKYKENQMRSPIITTIIIDIQKAYCELNSMVSTPKRLMCQVLLTILGRTIVAQKTEALKEADRHAGTHFQSQNLSRRGRRFSIHLRPA